MTTTNIIINYCLKGIGETEMDAPIEMSRAEVLEIVNQLYQYEIGKRLKNLAIFSYDESDGSHALIAGVGMLPSDFLSMHRVYDGDAPNHQPLQQIFAIEEKTSREETTQYMLPGLTNIWIFGPKPANTVKLYYYAKPTALEDSVYSVPDALKPEFHIDVFVARVKEVYAMRQNNTYDALDMKALVVDLLAQIEYAHSAEKRDESPRVIDCIYGGL